MLERNLEIRAQRNIMLQAIELFVFIRREGKVWLGEPVTMAEVDLSISGAPTLEITPEQAQVLMDELWNCGVRPSDVGSAGQLEAVKYHLEDLRRLVFNARSLKEE
ncbi:MAG: hypothetical protein FOGNACKC_00902 [Anaerolineae bacterium]|nr:hypothetical protein [Anaerolineae bacterium]